MPDLLPDRRCRLRVGSCNSAALDMSVYGSGCQRSTRMLPQSHVFRASKRAEVVGGRSGQPSRAYI